MIRFALLGVLLFSAIARPIHAAETVKIGYVDLRRALYETEDGRKARATLKKVFDQ